MRTMYKYTASSFADPADLEAFRRCKEQGGTDNECFAVGDNGEGCWGALTAQSHTPMVALHADDLIARWGSVAKAAHKRVIVRYSGRAVVAAVEDRCGIRGRIDLNPAAAEALGLNPPFLMPVEWAWIEG